MKNIFLLSAYLFLSTHLYGQSKVQIDSLGEALDRYIKSNGIPGAFIAITSADSTVYSGGLGFSDLQNQIAVSDETLFRMGSVTKVLTSLGILKMISEKKFSLNDDIKDLAPEIPISNPWSDKYPVKVIHLLEHTAGFEEMHWLDRYLCKEKGELTLLQVLQKTNSLNVRWPPGTAYSYSNPGFSVAGYLLEKYSDTSWKNYLREEILAPLQMNSSVLEKPGDTKNLARGYYLGEPVEFCRIHHSPAGAFNSNARDMIRFLRFILNKGKANSSDSTNIIPGEYFTQFETPSSSLAARNGITKGYALGISDNIFINPFGLTGHPGGIAGFTSFLGYDRESGFGYCIAINANADIYPLRSMIEKSLFRRPEREAQHQVDSTLSGMQENKAIAYTGFYELSNPRVNYLGFKNIFNPLNIKTQNKTLYAISDFFNKKVLIPTTDDKLLFRYTREDSASTVFSMADGRKVMATSYGAFYTKVSAFKVYLYRTSLALIISFIVYMVILLLLNSKKQGRLESYFTFSFFISIVMLTILYYLFSASDDNLKGQVNWLTISIFLASYAYFLFSFVALFISTIDWIRMLRKPTVRSLTSQTYYLLTGAALSLLAIHLYSYDLIGIKTWLY